MPAPSFATARPATVRAQIDRGVCAARAQQAARRVEAAVRDMHRRTAGRLRAQRLEEYATEYESHAWGWMVVGVAIGATIMFLAAMAAIK